MTQQDPDSEAFEKACLARGISTVRFPGYAIYAFAETQAFESIWQAARGHYAPKLTEKEALETAGTAIAEEMALISRGTPWEEGSDRLVRAAIKALRAAGVRFKEKVMKRFFYTDALAAAWMATHFKMDIRLDDPDGKVFLETTLILGLREWRDAIAASTGYKFYIHPDSLALLEPMIEDVGFDGTYSGVVANVSDSLITFETPERHNGKKYFCTARVAWKTVLRQSIAFHHPESEEV